MIPIFGSRKTLCDGLTRRDLLHIGGLGALGLGLADLFRLQTACGAEQPGAAAFASSHGFGKAKACILLYLYGSPAQHETFDPKPDAPAEIQGEMKAISTSVTGMRIGEGLPEIAKVMDRVTLVRSMTHPYPLHGTVYAMTGIPTVDPKFEFAVRDPRQWPFIGSIVDYLDQRRAAGLPDVPRNIALPYLFHSKANYHPLAGPYATFLGAGHDPVWTEFSAQGVKAVANLGGESGTTEHFYDPNGEIDPDERLRLSPALQLPDDVSRQRLDLRRLLLSQFDRARRRLDDRRFDTFSLQQAQAYSLLTSSKLRTALDVQAEPAAVRQRYGMTLFGQATLAARRLVEAGGRFVTVFWDAWKYNNGAWDTHYYHFPRLKQVLLPGLDRAYSALILDLEQRGLLDETLVLCFSEHGRTPKITETPGGGREHWSRAYWSLLAGAGIARGRVVGETDRLAGDVISTPVSPKDVLATAFHQLGIAPDTTVLDQQGRPWPIVGDGHLRHEFLEG